MATGEDERGVERPRRVGDDQHDFDAMHAVHAERRRDGKADRRCSEPRKEGDVQPDRPKVVHRQRRTQGYLDDPWVLGASPGSMAAGWFSRRGEGRKTQAEQVSDTKSPLAGAAVGPATASVLRRDSFSSPTATLGSPVAG